MTHEQDINDKAGRSLWRRWSHAAGGTAASCPDELRLAAYADGRMDGKERAAMEAHLADCSSCVAAICLAREIARVPHEQVGGSIRRRAVELTSIEVVGRVGPVVRFGRTLVAAAACVAIAFFGYRAGVGASGCREAIAERVVTEVTFDIAGSTLADTLELERELWAALQETSS